MSTPARVCRRSMKPSAALLPFLLASVTAAQEGEPVRYRLAFDPEEGLWDVEVRLPDVPAGEVVFELARWTPGAYHLADYGRFVDDDLEARGADGAALEVEREDDSRFLIQVPGEGSLTVGYRATSLSDGIFTENVIDVESNRIRPEYAYLNPVSVLGLRWEDVERPVELEVELPSGWGAATALEEIESGLWRAPSWRRLEDSPLLFSPELLTAAFEVEGRPHHVSAHGLTPEEHAVLVDGCRRIVEATSRLLQGLPYTHYHFLFGFVPEGQGSGLEHSYSTLILRPAAFAAEDPSLWSLTAHEFFHTWCAERIHVEGLHRPDQTEPFSTGTLWVNEGFTEYFTHHVLVHAGFLTRDEFLAQLGGRLPDFGQGAPSWTDVSRAAVGWGSMQDLMAFATRMYFLGPRTLFALDLEMRRASSGERGLLDLVRFLRRAYIDRDRGFEEGEMIDLASGIAQADLRPFYDRYIDGGETVDLVDWLDVIGCERTGGGVRLVEDLTAAQEAALEDFFSVDG